jgi:hypothetical protein
MICRDLPFLDGSSGSFRDTLTGLAGVNEDCALLAWLTFGSDLFKVDD